MEQGAGEAGRALRALRRPTEAARRSIMVGSTGFSRSLFSEFCLLKVGGRGRPGTTFLDSRRAIPGRCKIGRCFFSSSWKGVWSSRPSHRAMLKRCHMRCLCSIFSDSTDKGGESGGAIVSDMKTAANTHQSRWRSNRGMIDGHG